MTMNPTSLLQNPRLNPPVRQRQNTSNNPNPTSHPNRRSNPLDTLPSPHDHISHSLCVIGHEIEGTSRGTELEFKIKVLVRCLRFERGGVGEFAVSSWNFGARGGGEVVDGERCGGRGWEVVHVNSPGDLFGFPSVVQPSHRSCG